MAFMSSHAHFFALLEVENLEKQFADVLRKGTEVHTADVAAIMSAGMADGTIRDEDPMVAAYGVVGPCGLLRPLPPHRPLELDGPDELAAFVGRFVVCALASDESIARRVLAQRPP